MTGVFIRKTLRGRDQCRPCSHFDHQSRSSQVCGALSTLTDKVLPFGVDIGKAGLRAKGPSTRIQRFRRVCPEGQGTWPRVETASEPPGSRDALGSRRRVSGGAWPSNAGNGPFEGCAAAGMKREAGPGPGTQRSPGPSAAACVLI
jgi:hypothetical protein